MGNFKYPERLRQLDLPTLAYRRNRGDMIVTYKLLSGLYDEQVTLQLDMATIGQHHTITRGNSLKLAVIRCRFDLRKYCFTNRIVNMWNSLPDNVILANNVNQFKNRLDKHWKMHVMILYLIIAPTLLKPEVWHELIRMVKNGLSDLMFFIKMWT